MISHSVEELLTRYAKAFGDLDVQGQMDLMSDAFISAGPAGVIAHNKEEFRALATKMVDVYRSMGQEYVKLVSFHESRITDEYEIVNVRWGAKFKKIPNQIIEFDVSYLVQHTGGAYTIMAYITHQDEAAMARDFGLQSPGAQQQTVQ